MTDLFYIAFIVERDIYEGRDLVVEAGIDLLAGPFVTAADAAAALRETCARYPTRSAFAALAAYISVQGQRQPPAHISIVPVRPEHCTRYNAQHAAAALPWPPVPIPIRAATDTEGDDWSDVSYDRLRHWASYQLREHAGTSAHE